MSTDPNQGSGAPPVFGRPPRGGMGGTQPPIPGVQGGAPRTGRVTGGLGPPGGKHSDMSYPVR
jgi:hypothetical protein